ncbi:MAG: hypothetical protein AAFV29_20230, partial [Myxococcota bacterium]
TTHRETAEYILNQKRTELLALERKFGCAVVVIARPDIDRGKDEVVFLSMGEVLAEITDKLPPREERRRERERRKKKRKKKKERERAAVNGEAVAIEAVETEEESISKKKKRRKRKKAEGDSAPVAAKSDTKSDTDQQLEEKGTTFTGRPSPELLEKLKAARKARLSTRGASKPALVAEKPKFEAPKVAAVPTPPVATLPAVSPAIEALPADFDPDAEALDLEAAAALEGYLDSAELDPPTFEATDEAVDTSAGFSTDEAQDASADFSTDEAPDASAGFSTDEALDPSFVVTTDEAQDDSAGFAMAVSDADGHVLVEEDEEEAVELAADDDSETVVEPEMAAAMAADMINDADEVAQSARRRIRRSPPSRRRTPRSGDDAKKRPSSPPKAAESAGPPSVRNASQRRVEPALSPRPSPEPSSKTADQKARNRFLSRLFGG